MFINRLVRDLAINHYFKERENYINKMLDLNCYIVKFLFTDLHWYIDINEVESTIRLWERHYGYNVTVKNNVIFICGRSHPHRNNVTIYLSERKSEK